MNLRVQLRVLLYLVIASFCFMGGACPEKTTTYAEPETGMVELHSYNSGATWTVNLVGRLQTQQGRGIVEYPNKLVKFERSAGTEIYATIFEEFDFQTNAALYHKRNSDGRWELITQLSSISDIATTGTSGKGLLIGQRQGSSRIYLTNDFGTNWDTIPDSPKVNDGDIEFSDELHCMIVSWLDGVVVSSNGGTTWQKIVQFSLPLGNSPALKFISPTDTANAIICGEGGRIYRTSDFGRTWSEVVYSRQSNNLRSVDFHDGVGIIVGDRGTILRSTDAGATWTAIQKVTEKGLFRVLLTDARYWIVGANVVAVSDDKGLTWKLLRDKEGEYYRDVVAGNNGEVIIVGHRDY
jgi:photosystem II stability/assembly factor-like uncharacterized protein